MANVNTTTVLQPSPTSAGLNAEVDLLATVIPASGSATPIGNVQFKDGGTVLGTVAVDGGGLALLQLFTGLSLGLHTLTANYMPGAGFNPSNSGNVSFFVYAGIVTGTVVLQSQPGLFTQVVQTRPGRQSITLTSSMALVTFDPNLLSSAPYILMGTLSLDGYEGPLWASYPGIAQAGLFGFPTQNPAFDPGVAIKRPLKANPNPSGFLTFVEIFH